jgi:hypothetical protein
MDIFARFSQFLEPYVTQTIVGYIITTLIFAVLELHFVV